MILPGVFEGMSEGMGSVNKLTRHLRFLGEAASFVGKVQVPKQR